MISSDFATTVDSRIVRRDEDMSRLPLGSPWRVQTVNLHHLALSKEDKQFEAAIRAATYITADGWPVVALLRNAGIDCDRVTGSQWLRQALSTGTLRSARVGLLGGSAEAGRRLSVMLGSALVFQDHRQNGDWEAEKLVAQMRAAQVEVLLVAVTPPHGDLIAAELSKMMLPASIIAVGGGLDMAVGLQHRAPKWLADIGLEWAYRLARAPRRLARRYLLQCVPFLISDLLPAIIAMKYRRRTAPESERPRAW